MKDDYCDDKDDDNSCNDNPDDKRPLANGTVSGVNILHLPPQLTFPGASNALGRNVEKCANHSLAKRSQKCLISRMILIYGDYHVKVSNNAHGHNFRIIGSI